MRVKTLLRSRLMGVLASESLLGRQRRRARLRRRLRGTAPAVHYFHQADDPYSHLVAQKLAALQGHYGLDWRVHLVSLPASSYQGDASRFRQWALGDAISIAPFYKTELPADSQFPDAEAVRAANAALAGVIDQPQFHETAIEVGRQLWRGDMPDSNARAADPDQVLKAGNARRQKLGHYLGGMLHFEGEWFWGVDRLHLLEDRLRQEGFCSNADSPLVAPLPVAAPMPPGMDGSQISLEYFPSLRSPYTAIGHQRVMDLVQRTGVNFKLRPVMPMIMRGIPAPMAKQRYIISDAGREARYYGVPFGPFTDPLGDPVRRACSLFPALADIGKGEAYVGAYLSAAFAEGLDITNDRGLAELLGRIGVDPEPARYRREDWAGRLDDNVNAMLQAGLWGVPSFRVSGGNRQEPFVCWGQDRIWRVAAEITSRIQGTQERSIGS